MTNWTIEDLARELPTMRDDGESSSDVASVKLFTPWAGATWKLSEFDPATGIAFGLCDLGLGMPELGYVSVVELLTLRGPGGLMVERDDYYRAENLMHLAGLDSCANCGGVIGFRGYCSSCSDATPSDCG